MNNTFLTVVVAVHQQAEDLKRLLCWISSCDWSNRNIKFFFADSGKNKALLENFSDGDLIRYKSEPDKGIYDAWNKAVNLIQGEYVAFLGVTDRLVSSFSFRYDGVADMVALDFVRVSDSGRELVTIGASVTRAFPFSLKFCFSSALFRTEKLKQAPFNPSFKIIGDLAWVYVNRGKLRVEVVNETFCEFDLGGVSNQWSTHISRLREYRVISSRYDWNIHFLFYSVLSSARMLRR